VKFVRLRYRLLPYIYSLAGMITHQGYTMMRALAFDFARDSQACGVTDQYLFGPSLMVCPVTMPMYYDSGSTELQGIPKTRAVYLPAGCDWYDWWSGQKYSGGQTITADAPLDKMPIYARAGSVIPLGPDVQHSAENQDAPLDILVIPGRDATFLLYDDAGDGYGYEAGDYSFTRITWNDREQMLVLEPAGGMRPIAREFRVLLPGQAGVAENSQAAAVIQYQGATVRSTLA
jgi:alpha-D-xyloside xylohydrolase